MGQGMMGKLMMDVYKMKEGRTDERTEGRTNR